MHHPNRLLAGGRYLGEGHHLSKSCVVLDLFGIAAGIGAVSNVSRRFTIMTHHCRPLNSYSIR